MMNVNLQQILLFVVLLSTGFTGVSAHASCDQEELCEAQALVNELVEEIRDQHEVIESHWKALDSTLDRHTLTQWYERTRCLVNMVSRYLRIGTLESRLLVAYNKLSSVKVAMYSENPRCYCNDDIQLSASY